MKKGKKCKCSVYRGKMLPARTCETLGEIDEKLMYLGEEIEDLKAIRRGLMYCANKKQPRCK